MSDWTERADKAANFLTETDRKMAELKVSHERAKLRAKRTWSAIFMRVEGSVELRKAQAEVHEDYQAAQGDEMESLLNFESLRNERDTANTVIEFWRSYNKATKEGLV
jgi:hypothetical protein